MNRAYYIILSLLAFGCASAPTQSQLLAQSVGVQAVLGAEVSCDATNPFCTGFPSVLSVSCNGTNPACPDNWHPSWTTSGRFWGTRGTDCVTSTDSGATWGVCTTNPFTALGNTNIASAFDGSIIAVGGPAGVCTVRRSTDNGAIWGTTFTGGTDCNFGGPNAQNVQCQSGSNRCDFVGLVGATVRSYSSTDGGQNWTVVVVGTSTSQFNMVFDGTAGAAGGPLTTGSTATISTAGTFTLSSAWPGTAAPYFSSMGFLFGGVANFASGKNTTTFDRVNTDGVVQGTISPVGMGVPVGDFVTNSMGVLNYSGGFYYVIAFHAVGQGFWLSTNNLVTTPTLLGTNARTYGKPTMYKIGSKVYWSMTGGNFGVIQ